MKFLMKTHLEPASDVLHMAHCPKTELLNIIIVTIAVMMSRPS